MDIVVFGVSGWTRCRAVPSENPLQPCTFMDAYTFNRDLYGQAGRLAGANRNASGGRHGKHLDDVTFALPMRRSPALRRYRSKGFLDARIRDGSLQCSRQSEAYSGVKPFSYPVVAPAMTHSQP